MPTPEHPGGRDEHPGRGAAEEPAAEEDLDYRFTLANERTFLAWLRTALALLASAVATAQLVPQFSLPGARKTIALVLIVLSLLVAVSSLLRWRDVERAMRSGKPLPPVRTTWILSGGLLLVGLFVGVLIASGSGRG